MHAAGHGVAAWRHQAEWTPENLAGSAWSEDAWTRDLTELSVVSIIYSITPNSEFSISTIRFQDIPKLSLASLLASHAFVNVSCLEASVLELPVRPCYQVYQVLTIHNSWPTQPKSEETLPRADQKPWWTSELAIRSPQKWFRDVPWLIHPQVCVSTTCVPHVLGFEGSESEHGD